MTTCQRSLATHLSAKSRDTTEGTHVCAVAQNSPVGLLGKR